MTDDERAATERQRLVLVHDAQSPVRNLAAGEERQVRIGSDAPIDLTALEADRFPVQVPVTSSTSGHRTAAYSTEAEPVPRHVPSPIPTSSIVLEPTVMDAPRPDPSRLAPTVRRLHPDRVDSMRTATTEPDGRSFARSRVRAYLALGAVLGLLIGGLLMLRPARNTSAASRSPAVSVASFAPPPSLTQATIPPPVKVASETEATPPPPSPPAVVPDPKCVSSPRPISNNPPQQKKPARLPAADDGTPHSRSAKRNFE